MTKENSEAPNLVRCKCVFKECPTDHSQSYIASNHDWEKRLVCKSSIRDVY